MGRNKMSRKHLSFAIACALLAPTAWAQDTTPPATGSSDAKTLGGVTVTARKREETLQDVPVAVTAFTAETLDKLNVEDLADLDAQVPNLTIYAARGSNSTVTAYIRGVGQSDPLWGFDPGVGIYLDDVYIARPQGGLLDVFDVERVEVLRGPQGTLYGKNTIGGAIKYISRGLPATLDGFGSITVGNYNQLDAKAAIGGPIGGVDSGLRGRVAVASLNRDGFGENLTNGQEVTDKEINAVRLNLGAYAGDDLDVQFSLDWMDDQSGVRGAKMLAANPFAPAYPPLDDRYDIRSGMNNVNDTSIHGASMTVNWRPNEDWAVKYVLARRGGDTDTTIDFDTTPLRLVDVRALYSDDQTSHEFQVNFDAGGRSRGVFGIYKFDGDATGQIFNQFFNPAAPIGLTNPLFGRTSGGTFTRSIAAYADWTFDLTEQLKLDVGVRYTDEDKQARVLNQFFLANDFRTPWFTAANFDKTTNFENVSPKISLDYQLTPDIMVYGVASRGFKSGGYNIRANVVSAPISGEPFQDEQVDSYEVGSKMAFLDETLFLNLAYFYNDYTDIQLSVFTSCVLNGLPTFCADFTNAGSGTVQGLEAEYQWLPTRNWVLSGNLAWLDAQYDEYMFKGTNIADQQEFTNAPEFSGAMNLEYRTELASGGSLSARVGYSYQSDVVATTEVTRDPVTGVVTNPITQDGYGLVNAGVIWKLDDAWTLSLQGSNLADEEYRTTGYVIPAYGVRTGFYGAPRQYTVSVRYDF